MVVDVACYCYGLHVARVSKGLQPSVLCMHVVLDSTLLYHSGWKM